MRKTVTLSIVGGVLTLSFVCLMVRSWTYMESFSIGDPSSAVIGVLSDSGMIGVKFYPDIKQQFFETGFHSTRLSGDSLVSPFFDAGMSDENAVARVYFFVVPWWFFIGLFVAIFAVLVGMPGNGVFPAGQKPNRNHDSL